MLNNTIPNLFDVPDGYPEPSSTSEDLKCDSSNTHPSKQASRVTLAATLAAPTILYLKSALDSTVNWMLGNKDER